MNEFCYEMDQRANFLALILLDALEDENEMDVYTILERNAVDAGYVPQERGIAPIHYSCGMENERLSIDITRRFLEGGTNPNVLSCDNMTPLHVAAMYGRLEVLKMLLQYGAKLDMYDNDRKMPVHYAIEECHFDVVQIMRDHIFLDKYDRKQQEQHKLVPENTQTQQHSSLLSQTNFEHSVKQRTEKQQTSTPNMKENHINGDLPINKNLLCANEAIGKYTPNRMHYNYDVTSPYYINITHRRHKTQPLFPAVDDTHVRQAETKPETSPTKKVNATYNVGSSPEISTRPVNIFSLTRRNLEELSQNTTTNERSRVSLIEMWRERVQSSRQRPSILHEYDDVGQLIDQVVASDHLDFTNVVLHTKPKDGEVDSGACGSATSHSQLNETECVSKVADNLPKPMPKTPRKNKSQLANLLLQMACLQKANNSALTADSSYETVPELNTADEAKENCNFLQVPQVKISTDAEANAGGESFIRSPNNDEFFMQMTEAYVHTDDENGLVFYETKLLTNPGNKVAQLRQSPKDQMARLDATMTSQSTNFTLPPDYETDALRAELTTFGEPPGPITKSTKRLYIKRLIKYKRRKAMQIPTNKNGIAATNKYSIELYRTVRCQDAFQRIPEFVQYEKQSAEYFANHQNKRQMREGHLKQSFIYMLIDPRVSCNLPGESVFLEKFEVWKRFLESIFYVGKGKTSRPYSHLYAAMKTHSRLHSAKLAKDGITQGQSKMPFRKEKLNVDLFKSPPTYSSDSKKLDRILDIWSNSVGVVCLHVFHNIMPTEAYTREAAIIDALSLQHLTNVKRGDYYGPARTWTMREKKYFGIALLYKAMQIYLAEGESQLSPSDLI